MTGQFSFSFAGDDIDHEEESNPSPVQHQSSAAGQQQQQHQNPSASASAFPVQGKPLLPPTHHDLDWMLSRLPSRVAYNTLPIDLDGKGVAHLPRRELWDVRVQLMAEEEEEEQGRDEAELEPGLGKHDVKTGIYEGGFKSWESSVDLVKVLAGEGFATALAGGPCRVIELGCGTGLPSLALFQWAAAMVQSGQQVQLDLILADYNPSVLYLVTLPNFIISWALQTRETNSLVQEALTSDEEALEITPELLEAFKSFLATSHISLSFCSGAWSPEFVELLYSSTPTTAASSQSLQTLIIGAETIYSPYALAAFSDTVHSILQREKADRPEGRAAAIVGAKKLYFGVGGSLDDFVERMRSLGTTVDTLREETGGVRRGVVRCVAS